MKVDSLLQYLPDNPDQFECWIGLNDIATEAGSDADAFVWVDGTNSTFRNFATNYPKNGDSRDCGLFGFNQIVISGWFEKPCNQSATCYFCSKPSKYLHFNQCLS